MFLQFNENDEQQKEYHDPKLVESTYFDVTKSQSIGELFLHYFGVFGKTNNTQNIVESPPKVGEKADKSKKPDTKVTENSTNKTTTVNKMKINKSDKDVGASQESKKSGKIAGKLPVLPKARATSPTEIERKKIKAPMGSSSKKRGILPRKLYVLFVVVLLCLLLI